MRDEAKHDRVELVSGRQETEAWKETNASGLPEMFKIFRKEFAAELTKRFELDTTPSSHILLALKMNPAINTAADSPLLSGKSAMAELMTAEYKRALRRQCLRQKSLLSTHVVAEEQAAPQRGCAPATGQDVTTLPAAEANPTPPEPKRRKSL